MNWIYGVWTIVGAVCLTLGLIELRVGLSRPTDWARLLFSLNALATSCECALEVAAMSAQSPAEFQVLLRWGNVVMSLMITSLATFVWIFFRSGNRWLAIAGPALFVAALAFNFAPGSSVVYLKINALKTVETLSGATYRVAEGQPNPWNILTYLSPFMLLIFVLDASIGLARRGELRRAVVIGGSVALWVLAVSVQDALIEYGVLQMPYMQSILYLIIILAMSYELTAEIAAAARVGRELRDSEKRMDLASAAAGIGMWTWNLNNQDGWASPKAQTLLGFSVNESLSQARFLEVVHPEDREGVRVAFGRSISAGDDLEVEHRVRTPDGETRWLAVRGRVERDAGGKPALMRGVALDISGRRRSELELQRLQGELAHTSRVSMMGQLATALAHELHQPLGAILRNAEAGELFLDHVPPDLKELRSILTDIRADDQRAREVIDRLRSLLKKGTIDPRSLSVSEVFAKISALTRAEAVTRNIVVDTDSGSSLPPVIGDAVHLQQVLLNLVLNSMDAIDAAAPPERLITVRAEQRGGREVEVVVSDSGPGIAPEKLAVIFEPFFTTKASGMGIGLSVSRTIIEAHGGLLWAEIAHGKGATFHFTLPTALESLL
jgi:two-component system, LuxR family, sensor kinase FixL